MKKHSSTILFLLFLNLFLVANAQDEYSYSLVDNGSFNYTVIAIPNANTNNFATSVQSYGFTIILPDGVTASITSSLGNTANATFFDGNAVGQTAVDGYLITETLGSPVSLAAPSTATPTVMITMQLDQSPTAGSIYILENNSALATTITSLKSFMQADTIDNGMAEFVNVVNSNATGVSGTSSFDFSTLSVTTNELSELTIYPNPVKEHIHISQLNTNLLKAELYNLNGQLVLSQENNLTTIHVSKLQSGIYMLKLYSENAQRTIKIVKE
jgi:hypothetical protein